jgi:hypothetical protein
MKRAIIAIGLLLMTSCMSNDKTLEMLRSQKKDDVIRGAIRAGHTKNKIFVPYLLTNITDQRMSTNVYFYGVTVYQAKMEALEKIFGQSPPREITYLLDSAVVKFYTDLAEKEGLTK